MRSLFDIDLRKLPRSFWVGLGLEALGASSSVVAYTGPIKTAGLCVFGVGFGLCWFGLSKATSKEKKDPEEPPALRAALPRSYVELLVYVAGAAAMIAFRHEIASFVFAGMTDHPVGLWDEGLVCFGILTPFYILKLAGKKGLNHRGLRCFLILLGLSHGIGFFSLFCGFFLPQGTAAASWLDPRMPVGLVWLGAVLYTHFGLKIKILDSN